MHQEAQEELRGIFRVAVLEIAQDRSVTQTCQDFKVPRSSFYRWKKRYDQEDRSGLYHKKPIANTHPRKTAPEVKIKSLYLHHNKWKSVSQGLM